MGLPCWQVPGPHKGNMKSLVIGAGQIGKALHQIFSKAHECSIRDKDDLIYSDVSVLHIAYPYSDEFVNSTKGYIHQYNPELTVIHSTVAVGTTDELGEHVVHSPERGRFPNLADQMFVFPKFIGGGNIYDQALAKEYFDELGWQTVLVPNSKWTELSKLLSNVHLALEIAWRQEVDRIAVELTGEPANAIYSSWEHSYVKALAKLEEIQLIRPIMRPNPIGGHCILPCTDILSDQYSSPFFDLIRESNAKRQTEEDSADDGKTVYANNCFR